ncbi:hypothetical protein J3R30DRAFT_3289137 [Lentinula aciculospora]|uniref:Uncharacterized protein n=1 Tax=Lentinula aciculospora TaxID=153920 RepID=A0A9W9ACA9_9AGAR|nr:hypothetical protein J3R30DRAFT_3289137 [Lentinula aciculospora]
MSTVQSSRNPFRNQAAVNGSTQTQSSPLNEASTSTVSSARAGTSVSPPPASTIVPHGHSISDQPSSSSSSSPASSSPDILNEELPPAYTIAPDSSHGEQTVEYGPRRPFQNAPPPVRPSPPQHPISAQSTGWSAVQSHVMHPPPPPPSQPQSLWQQITGHLADQLTGLSTDSPYNRYGTYPNTHHTGSSYSPSPPSQSSWIPQQAPNIVEPPPLPPRRDVSQVSPTSEFAQEFYAAGAGSPPDHEQTSRYPPPSGPLPSGSPRSSLDEGRPTKTPVPGHPLLNHGKLLVYPPGFECDKCHNIGYKQNDPSNPCRKCWSKYAKPFSGVITYSSFKTSSVGTGKTFQRPLPILRPPQAGISRPHHYPGYPGSTYAQNLGQGQNSSTTRPSPPTGSYPPYSRPSIPPPPNIQMIPGGHSAYGPPQPPPGSVVYGPGDPRLGGRLCWRCDGDGMIGAFLFQEQCSVCGGLGRTYT